MEVEFVRLRTLAASIQMNAAVINPYILPTMPKNGNKVILNFRP